jgi:hypothetical protein
MIEQTCINNQDDMNSDVFDEQNIIQKSDIYKKYLCDPFYEHLNNESFKETRNTLFIVCGGTGLGKTYFCANEMIPHLLNKERVDFVCYSVPNIEILDDNQIIQSLEKNCSDISFRTREEIHQVINDLENNIQTVLSTTHQMLLCSSRGQDLQEYLLNSDKKIAFIIDEIHMWTTSHISNYKDNMGSDTPEFQANLYNTLELLSVKTPYLFGLSATPTSEQISKLKVVGNMTYKILNDFCPSNQAISRMAWINKVSFHDADVKNDVAFKFINHIRRFVNKEKRTNIKQSMLIVVNRENSKDGYGLSEVSNLLKAILKDINYYDPSENVIAYMTGTYKYIESTNSAGRNNNYYYNSECNWVKKPYKPYTDQEIIEIANDPECSVRFILLIEKGKCGMNIHNAKSLFSFRTRNGLNTQGESVIENTLQLCGRLTRIYTGVKNKDFTAEYGYELTNYVKKLKFTNNKKELNNLFKVNSFDITVANTKMWKDGMKVFKKKYTCPLKNAKKWAECV